MDATIMASSPIRRSTIHRLLRNTLCLVLMAWPLGSVRAEVLLERAVVVTGEWAPITSARMEGSGLLSALVTEVLKGMDRDPEYEFLPFSAALAKTRDGKAIGTFPWFMTEDRAREFVYSEPILDVEYVIFFNPTKDSRVAQVKSFEELEGLPTLRVDGYAYGELDCLLRYETFECPSEAGEATGNRVESEFLAFEALRLGDIDYLAASRAVGESLIRRSFSLEDQHKFAILERPELRWSMNVHFLFPKNRSDADELKRAFDDALKEVKASGRVAELRQRLAWGGRWKGNLVVLDDPTGSDAIGGLRYLDDETVVVTPRGTRAVVVEWSPRFRGETLASQDDEAMTRVQLINGPHRDERLWVRDEFIRLADDGLAELPGD